MDYFTKFGIIFCVIVANSVAQEFVTVGRDITVKPTPNPLIDLSNRVDVELNCTGSRSDLSYYIKNRVEWTYIRPDGYKLPLTEGFYTSSEAQDLFFGSNARYLLTYKRDVKGYRFDIKITGLTEADNGIFRCSLLDEFSKVIDFKDVVVTVVKPIQEVSIELHDMSHAVLAQNSAPLSINTTSVEIPPGDYMVQCDAHGSNPAPMMTIWYNEIMLNSEVVAVKVQETYNASVSIMSQTLKPHSAIQVIMCTANIPGEFYPEMQTGISLMVVNRKPEVICANFTTMVGNRYAKFECEVTTEEVSKESLNCNNINWLLGDENVYINESQRWIDPSGKFDILETACEKSANGLSVSMTIYKVKSVHFEELFYVIYESDGNTYRYPVPEFHVEEYNTATINIVSSLALVLSVSIASLLNF